MQFLLIVLIGVFAEVSLRLGFPRETIASWLLQGLQIIERGVGIEQLFK